ncbi:MAG: hypothetical protein LKE53_10520 [Oscillospiraceae bacterium]|jgi:hypothetical protein|nr:hypothetical protein [Oscillospiraceae bacterium]MDD3230408.1 hypothetical protein [Oscillospiraceae bacterium]
MYQRLEQKRLRPTHLQIRRKKPPETSTKLPVSSDNFAEEIPVTYSRQNYGTQLALKIKNVEPLIF